ncbi:hypothetical protein LXJ57_25715, partial [Escherichia coli]|nr:hypothetical protein [Escherichia coli]
WDRVVWTTSVPAAGIGQKARIEAFRDAVQGIDGLAVVGAWLAGNGLVSVISDARAQAQRLA